GIIPPGNPAGARSPYDKLRAISSEMFGPLSSELRERTGIDNGYRVCGGIDFRVNAADEITVGWKREGIPFEALAPAELRELEPAIAEVPGSPYHLPGMAQVRNPRHLKALHSACASLGVRFTTHVAVTDWEISHDAMVAARLQDGTRRSASQYLIAAGA